MQVSNSYFSTATQPIANSSGARSTSSTFNIDDTAAPSHGAASGNSSTNQLATPHPFDSFSPAALGAQEAAFSQQLHQAAADAGVPVSGPITIHEGAKDEFGRHKPVVDPSTPNADKIQALLDNNPDLNEAYHKTSIMKELQNVGRAAVAYSRAYSEATTPAEALAVYQRYAPLVQAAASQPVTIKA
jgi:hypothetical protein